MEIHHVIPRNAKNCFFMTQILREIKFGQWHSRSAKSAILTHLQALTFELYEFLHFLKAEIQQINHFQEPLKWQKLQF